MVRYTIKITTDLPLIPLLYQANHKVQLPLMLSQMQAGEMPLSQLSEKKHEWFSSLPMYCIINETKYSWP